MVLQYNYGYISKPVSVPGFQSRESIQDWRVTMSRSLLSILILISFSLLPVVPGEKTEQTQSLHLSPENWAPGDLQKFNELQQQVGRLGIDVAKGSHGVIVGILSPQSQRAGLEALYKGGSAADAVLTASLATIALEAGSVISYAGILTMVYYDAQRTSITI
jgi:hypothetical protein